MPLCHATKADGSPCTFRGIHHGLDGYTYCGHHKERGNRPALPGIQPVPAAAAPAAPAAPEIPRLRFEAVEDDDSDTDEEMPVGHPLLRRGPAEYPLLRREPNAAPAAAAPPRRMYEQIDAMLRGLQNNYGLDGLEYAARTVASMARNERRRIREAEAEAMARAAAEALRAAMEAQAAEAARAAEAAAARNAEFQRQLREEPVVFQRDPEGGIDLAAFARDAQSVHRSSVQSMTERAVRKLVQRPVPFDQDTLPEIFEALSGPVVRWYTPDNTPQSNAMLRTRVITEFTENYFEMEAFSIKYSAVVDAVWAFIRSHAANKNDLILRLAQELAEGLGMCSNGKMARLVNVLQGFDDSVEAPVPPKEIFQNKIAAVAKMPLGDRKAAADALFAEYGIPQGEQADWLAPLLESDA